MNVDSQKTFIPHFDIRIQHDIDSSYDEEIDERSFFYFVTLIAETKDQAGELYTNYLKASYQFAKNMDNIKTLVEQDLVLGILDSLHKCGTYTISYREPSYGHYKDSQEILDKLESLRAQEKSRQDNK